MIVDKKLIVSNRRKIEIVTDLRHHKFKPIPKVAQVKSVGEPEEENDNDDDNDSDYDYLLGMAIWSLTREKVSMSRLCFTPLKLNNNSIR